MLRIKEKPEDFYVKEIKELRVKPKGRFAYFLLWKKDLTTLEALREVARTLRVPLERIGFGGLKDKRAITEQYVSVEGLKEVREVEKENLKLKFLGYGDKPVSLGEIEGNYFEIVVRGVGERKRKFIRERMDFVRKFGFENYFGEQRFGSVKHAQEFMLKHLLKGDYESALREYLTSLRDKRRKKALLRTWGRWKEFLKFMPEGSKTEIVVVKKLLRGKSFREAFLSIPRNVRLMFTFAYQSYLWNRYLSTFVVRYFKHCSVPFLKWRLAFITEIGEEIFDQIRDLEIPYLGTEEKPGSKKIELIIKEILEEEGIKPNDLEKEIDGMKLFIDGRRRAFVFPEGLKILEEGKGILKLSFTLPPGSYATILLRKLSCSSIVD